MLDNRFACFDGTICAEKTCCTNHGGIARCPANVPKLCEEKVGASHICDTSCDLLGGERRCLSAIGLSCEFYKGTCDPGFMKNPAGRCEKPLSCSDLDRGNVPLKTHYHKVHLLHTDPPGPLLVDPP